AQRSSAGGARGGTLHRLDRADYRTAPLPRPVLGVGRRGGRGQLAASASGPVRIVPRAAGRGACRATRDRGQRPHRPGERRPRLLAHRNLRATDAQPHHARRAGRLGLAGAAFPWRTIHGQECSGYWPAGTAAFHVNADIAYAASHHVTATGDADFERDVALELLVQTARLWRSLGHHDLAGHFRIDGVTGPDEYSAIADNNV